MHVRFCEVSVFGCLSEGPLPCLVSPEREDLVETVDCVETMEDVSAMVLSDMMPSSSAWAVTVDWQKHREFNQIYQGYDGAYKELCKQVQEERKKQETSDVMGHLQCCFRHLGS